MKNSESDLKRDLRVTHVQKVHDVIFRGSLSELMSGRGAFKSALPPLETKVHDVTFEDLDSSEVTRDALGNVFGVSVPVKVHDDYFRPEVVIVDDSACTYGWDLAKPGSKCYTVEGLVNDPAVGRKTTKELAADVNACFENLGKAADKVLLIGAGGTWRASGKSNARMVFLAAVAMAEMRPESLRPRLVIDSSPHPGERHREVERQQHSKRSRAGKAGRWS